MTNETNKTRIEDESAGNRAITIAIFIAVIVFLVWLAVQAVGLVPNAFTSLASLADSMYGQDKRDAEVVILDKNAVLDHDKTHTLTWSDIGLTGNYYFSYECTDGISLKVEYPKDTVRDLACGEEINLGNSTEIAVRIASEKKRFTEVPYNIAFIDTDNDIFETKATVTVMNAAIPASQDFTDNEGIVAGQDTSVDEEEPVTQPEPEPQTPVTPTTPTTPQQPVYVEVPVYAIPVSDPKGSVDLAAEVIGVGYLANGNQFVAQATIDNDRKGAVQFRITNLGTKTSDDFSFEAKLPNGQTFKSGRQKGLKPNEHSTLTLGFSSFDDTGVANFDVRVDVDDDVNSRNNTFRSSVIVTD